jgi:hypothetical protein
LSAWWPGELGLALAGPFGVFVAGDNAGAGTAADEGGPLAGTMRPGGPRTGKICGPLCADVALEAAPRVDVCALVCEPLPDVLTSVACPPAPSPSTNAKRPSFLSFSRSRAAPFRASCLQKSYSLIHETKTTSCPSSPPSCGVVTLSAWQRNRTSSQFALAPSVLVSKRTESSRGS